MVNSVMRLMCVSPCPLYASRDAEGAADGRGHDDDYFEDEPLDGSLFVLFFHEIVDLRFMIYNDCLKFSRPFFVAAAALFFALDVVGRKLLELRFEFQPVDGEGPRGAAFEAQPDHVGGDRPVFRRVGRFPAYAHAEDGEVVQLHVLAVEQQLLDAGGHVLEDPVDRALRIRRVVLGHVLGQGARVERLVRHRPCQPLAAERGGLGLVLILILLVTNHVCLFFLVDNKENYLPFRGSCPAFLPFPVQQR